MQLTKINFQILVTTHAFLFLDVTLSNAKGLSILFFLLANELFPKFRSPSQTYTVALLAYNYSYYFTVQ